MIVHPMGQTWLWTSTAEMLQAADKSYFENFWTKPGYIGHDFPELVADDLIDVTLPVPRVVRGSDFMEDSRYAGPEFDTTRPIATMMSAMGGIGDMPIAVEVEGVGKGYRLGTGVKVVSGKAAGRQLYCLNY